MFKRLALVFSLVVGFWAFGPTSDADARRHRYRSYDYVSTDGCRVPELDPSSAGAAMVLLLGGVAYVSSRRREQESC